MLTTHPSIEVTAIAGRPAYVLVSDDGRLRATVVPDLAMLISSLTLDGMEFLGRPNTVEQFAERWATTGVPLLHPWANRLSGPRLVGVDMPTVDTASPLVPTDDGGLAIHGVNLADAGWTAAVWERARSIRATASMRFDDPARCALFPFPHELSVTVELRGHELRITTEVRATGSVRVPVAFGWHPYFQIPGVSRTAWQVRLPVTRRAILDERMIPTGDDEPVDIRPGRLGDATYDDMFTELEPLPVFELSGGGRWIDVAFGAGYPIAQVYAPTSAPVIAFEPMTAPVDALVSGDGLRWVAPGGRFAATFAIRVGTSRAAVG